MKFYYVIDDLIGFQVNVNVASSSLNTNALDDRESRSYLQIKTLIQSDCFSTFSLSYLEQKKGNKGFNNAEFCKLLRGKRVKIFGWLIYLISSALEL